MITGFKACDAFTNFKNDTGAFVPQDCRERTFGIITRKRKGICVTDPGSFDLN
jgi:hypothetical protein